MNLNEYAVEMGKWERRNWPDKHPGPFTRALKVSEETGELAGAVVKMNEGRRSLDDVRGEWGDVLITLLVLADHLGFDPDEALAERWAAVGQRDSRGGDMNLAQPGKGGHSWVADDLVRRPGGTET